MQNVLTFQARTFPVKIKNQRTGEESTDFITLDKRQIAIAQDLGLSGVEIIVRLYNKKKFDVLKIDDPVKREIKIDLTALAQEYYAMWDDDFNQIAVFSTPEKRDAWTAFQDEFARQIGDLPEYEPPRIPIPFDMAREICGKIFNNPHSKYEEPVSGIWLIDATTLGAES